MRKRRTGWGRRGPQAISDRNGRKYPYNEMVVEPGTGYLVHRSETDGRWNRIDHPQNSPPPFRMEGQQLPNARPDIPVEVTQYFIVDNEGNYIVSNFLNKLIYKPNMV